jgi:hypothetical protein
VVPMTRCHLLRDRRHFCNLRTTHSYAAVLDSPCGAVCPSQCPPTSSVDTQRDQRRIACSRINCREYRSSCNVGYKLWHCTGCRIPSDHDGHLFATPATRRTANSRADKMTHNVRGVLLVDIMCYGIVTEHKKANGLGNSFLNVPVLALVHVVRLELAVRRSLF